LSFIICQWLVKLAVLYFCVSKYPTCSLLIYCDSVFIYCFCMAGSSKFPSIYAKVRCCACTTYGEQANPFILVMCECCSMLLRFSCWIQLCLCVQLNSTAARMINGSARRRSAVRNSDDVLNSMWNAIRSNNGIMVRFVWQFIIIRILVLFFYEDVYV